MTSGMGLVASARPMARAAPGHRLAPEYLRSRVYDRLICFHFNSELYRYLVLFSVGKSHRFLYRIILREPYLTRNPEPCIVHGERGCLVKGRYGLLGYLVRLHEACRYYLYVPDDR